MKIPHSLLETQVQSSLRNYLYTFGFIIITDFFLNDEIEELNRIWTKDFNNLQSQNQNNTPTYRGVLNYVEQTNSPIFTGQLGDRFINLVDLFCGQNAIYGGSSATEMDVPTPWHRDIYIKTPVFKFSSYINNSKNFDGLGGELCVIPGSQHAGDLYADAVGGFVDWPESGGMYKKTPILPMLQAGDGSSSMSNYPQENALVSIFPWVKLEVSAKDLIIFDQRLVHGSTLYTTGRSRRMITMAFAPSPNEISKNSKLAGLGYKKIDAILELEKWFRLQVESGPTDQFYEKVFKNQEISKKLGVKLDHFKDLRKINQIKTNMREDLDANLDFYMKNMQHREMPVAF